MAAGTFQAGLEAARAPFDPLSTTSEVALNIGATAAFGALLMVQLVFLQLVVLKLLKRLSNHIKSLWMQLVYLKMCLLFHLLMF